jgi:hypothetical protein
MEHADFPVDILDKEGRITGQKPRRAVNKRMDIYHGVHVVLMTPRGELVVSLIPQREELPNLYADLLGSTMATIRRHGETAEEAARRGLRRELLIDEANLRLLCDGMTVLDDGRPTYLTAFLVEAERPLLYRLADIGELVVITPEGVDLAMTVHADRFAPTMKAIWPSLQKLKTGPGDHDRV